MVTPERNVPVGILIDIREMYKEIRSRLTEVKAIEQLLQGKYRQYYKRDSMRDKEIMEIGFTAKNCYSKFEFMVMQKEAKKRLKEGEQSFEPEHQHKSFSWFHSKENQLFLSRNLRILNELDYEMPPDLEGNERREVIQNRPRSLTLFVFSGEEELINVFHSRIRMREHDTIERYGRNELRGVLTHLKEVQCLEVEKVFQRIMEGKGFSKLKCLLLPIHSHKDLKKDILDLVKTTLQGMSEGEVKTISI